MYKKFLAGLLAFALVFGSAAALPATELKNGGVISVSAEGDTLTYGDFEYVSYGDSVAIRKYNGNDANVVIPSEINGKSVTSINGISEWYSPWGEYIYDGAFEDNKNLVNVTIPATVTSIGAETFSGCSNLKSVSFSENVTSIGCKAFYNCTQLTDIENINNLNIIEAQAFEGTKWLEEQRELNPLVIINNTVIDGRTIKGTATIPEGITRIAPYAFRDTITVTEVEFPSTLEYIGERAFSNCYCINTIILPDSVENIGDCAFQYCTALKFLKMPDNEYADIGIYVFRGCSNIKEITWGGYWYKGDFGDSIDTLLCGDSLSKDCLIRCKYNSSAYKYAKENGYNYEFTNVFNNFACDKYEKGEWDNEKEEYIVVDEGYEIYAYLGDEAEITIPSTINNKKVYSVEFYDDNLSDNVKTVNISNGIENFECYSKIESVNIPQSLEKFGCSNTLKKIIYDDGCTKTLNCCHGQTSLETVILPDSLIEISSEEFWDCINLKSLYIPAGVSNDISSRSFVRCLNLGNITVDNDNKKYSSENGMIYSKDKSILYYVPNAKESVTVSSKTRIISNGAFNNCVKLNELNLPNNLEKIENGGLLSNIGRNYSLGCDVPLYPPLKSIVIPKSVKSLENSGLGFYMAYPYDIQLPNFKIYCYSNSAGEKYAKDNGFDYELLDKPAVNGTGKVSIENSTSGLKVENISVNIAKSGSGKTDKTIKIGSDGKFTVEGLADGKYDFTFTADKCVPRTYSVSVSGGTFKLDSVELHLYGDVNGDGKITTADVGKTNADTRNSKKLTDSYDKKVADANGDGKITTADVGKVNAHVRGTKNLW